VTMLRINSFIATLATGFMFIGLAQVLTSGNLISITDPGFQVIGTDALLGVKYSTWIFILAVVASAIVLRYTVFGRYVFSVGGNSVAARLSGVNVNLVRLGTFALSGLLAGVAGVIAASRVATGQIDAGAGLELTAIAAVVIGGTSIMGGEGAIWRTVLGLLILALIGNGFNILNVEPFYQSIVQGGVIVIAVAIDAWGRRRD
jgi:ribose transport system permease protein